MEETVSINRDTRRSERRARTARVKSRVLRRLKHLRWLAAYEPTRLGYVSRKREKYIKDSFIRERPYR